MGEFELVYVNFLRKWASNPGILSKTPPFHKQHKQNATAK